MTSGAGQTEMHDPFIWRKSVHLEQGDSQVNIPLSFDEIKGVAQLARQL